MAHFFSYFFSFRGIAQLVEQRSPKPRVVSSILTAPAIKKPVDTSSMGFNFFVLFEKWVVCALNVHYELNAVISVIPRFCYVDPDRLRESIGIFSIL